MKQQAVSVEQAFRDLQLVSLEEIEFPKLLDIVASYALTSRGQEQILSLEPSLDVESLQSEHELIDEMLRVLFKNEDLPLEHIEDVSALLSKSQISGAALSAPQILEITDVLSAARRLRLFINQRSEELPHLSSLAQRLVENRMLEKHINEAIDRGGVVRDNASRELQTIRHEIQATAARLRSRLNKIASRLGEEDMLQDEYITQRDGRFVIPLKTNNKRILPGIIHGVSASGSTVFMEPAEVFEMNNELSLLHNDEQREVLRILTMLTAEIGSVASELMSSLETLTRFDSIHARARYALAVGGRKPRILEEGECELVKVYHPLLKHGADSRTIIPLSIRFDKEQRGHLISGPNAGGKSVALKSIGLNLAMALAGIFPLGDCVTSPRKILVAIGDHQSIESNLSTFSSLILRLKEILSFCAADSLVLVDEICSGTDPTEGSALAAGILDSLRERHAYFVVTTHQSSLKSYALSHPHITNDSLEFDAEKLAPTYNFLQGVPGNSYAFELARSVDLPDIVLDRARAYLGDRHDELEQSISALQKFRLEAEKLNREARHTLQEADKKKEEYQKRFNDFKAKYQQLMLAAQREAAETVKNAKAELERLMREVREQQRSPKEIHADLDKLRHEITENIRQLEPGGTSSDDQFAVGDFVKLKDSEQSGVISAIDDNKAVVDFNGIHFRVELRELRKTAQKPKVAPRSGSPGLFKLDAAVTSDLRGMRVGEAIAKLDIQLSDAIVGNVPFLSIIHGKGTGALRQAVHDYLRDHPSVASFRIGAIGEGDSGVTQVELR